MLKSLVDAIDGLKAYHMKINDGASLNGEDLASVLAYTVNMRAYKSMLGKMDYSDDEFVTWVAVSHQESLMDHSDPTEGTMQFKNLADHFLQSLFDAIDGLQGYQKRIELGDDLNAEDMAAMLANTVNLKAFKSMLDQDLYSDDEFMNWVFVNRQQMSQGPVQLMDLAGDVLKSLFDSIDAL